MPSAMNVRTSLTSCESAVAFLPSSETMLPPLRVEELEEVDRQALVAEALVDDAVVACGLLVERLPVLRRRADLVGAVVDEARVGVERDGPVLALELRGVHRGLDELVAVLRDVVGDVLQPALGGVLRGPDHVHAEHVALGGLGAQALDLKPALLDRVLRQLEELDVGVRVRLVEVVDDRSERAGRVLADAPRHVAGGLRLGGLLGRGCAAAVVAATAAAGDCEQRGHYKRGQHPRGLHHPNVPPHGQVLFALTRYFAEVLA